MSRLPNVRENRLLLHTHVLGRWQAIASNNNNCVPTANHMFVSELLSVTFCVPFVLICQRDVRRPFAGLLVS